MGAFTISPEEFLVRSTAQDNGVDPDVAARIAHTESGYDQNAVSPKGARGIMQLMPATAKDLGVDPGDMASNIEGGVRYYKTLLDRYNGDERKAAAAYNAGPERVDSGKPLPAETQAYIDKVAPLKDFTVSPEDFLNSTGTPPTTQVGSPSTQVAPPAQDVIPGMERLGGVPPAAGQPPPLPSTLQPHQHIVGPLGQFQPGAPETGPAPTREQLGYDPQFAQRVHDVWTGSDLQKKLAVDPVVLNALPPDVRTAIIVAQTAAGLASPENLATMIATDGMAGAFKAAANTPRLAKLLTNFPGVRQAIDKAASSAIPATFSGLSAYQGVKGGVEAVDAHEQGDDDKATQYATQAVTNLLFAALGAVGAHEAIKGTAAAYPTAEASTGRAATPEVEELLKKSGATAPPTPAQQEAAGQVAQVLQQRGQNLAAQSWQNIADWDKFNALQPIQIGTEGYVLERNTKLGQEPLYSLKDSAGKVVVRGSREAVRDHIQQMTIAPPGQQVTGEAGPQETVPTEQPLLPGGGPPAEPTPETKPSADIVAGAQFQVGNRSYTVKSVENGKVTYSMEGATSKPVTLSVPLTVFQKTVAAANPAEKEQEAEKPAVTSPQSTEEFSVTPEEFLAKSPEAAQPQEQAPVAPKEEVITQPTATTEAAGATETLTSENVPHGTSRPVSRAAEATREGQQAAKVEQATKPNAEVEQAKTESEQPEGETPKKLSSTQVSLPPDVAEKALAWSKRLPANALHDEGRETDLHATVKYGLHDEDSAATAKAIEGEGPITAKLGAMSVFKGATPEDPDVLKIDVTSPDLHRLNAKVGELPHTDTYPTYVPHVTLGYFKRGEADKYAGKIVPGVSGKAITLNSVTFSSKNGQKAEIPLRGKVETPETHTVADDATYKDVRAFWDRLKAGDTIQTRQGDLEVTGAHAFNMQPVLPTRGGLAPIGHAAREVTDVTVKMPDGSERKFGHAAALHDFASGKKEETAPQTTAAPVAATKPADLVLAGNTYPSRYAIKRLGAKWNKKDQAWSVADTPSNRAAVAAMKGVEIQGGEKQEKEEKPAEIAETKEPTVKRVEKEDKETPARAPAESQPKGKIASAMLRKGANALQNQIDSKRNSGISQQNPTARRNRIAAGMANEADRLEPIQKVMRALADLHDSGEVPPLLVGVKSRGAFESLMPRYDEQGKRVESRFPSAFLRPGAAREILEKIKGVPGVSEGRRILESVQYSTDGSRLGEKQIGPVEEAMDAAVKRGWNDKYNRDDLTRARRLYSIGINEQNYKQAVDAIDQLGVKKREPTAEEKIAAAERELAVGSKIEGYFPTPKPLAREMVKKADIKSGMSVLEPSAGNGNIADAIKAEGVAPDVIEPVSSLRGILEAKKYKLIGNDFMGLKSPNDLIREDLGVIDKTNIDAYDPEKNIRKTGRHWTYTTLQGNSGQGLYDTKHEAVEAAKRHKEIKLSQYENPSGYGDAVSVQARKSLALIKKYMDQGMSEMDAGARARAEITEGATYDRIVMNPPFERGQDMDHVRHAYDLLNPGGRIVAIMSEGSFGRGDKKAVAFREWLDGVKHEVDKLPEGSFTGKDAMRQTGVAARLVEIEKPTIEKEANAKGEPIREESGGRQGSALPKADVGIRPERRGEKTTVLVPGEATEYHSQYGLRELDDLRSSHHGFSFQKQSAYPYTNDRDYTKLENQKRVIGQAQNFNPRYLITDNPDATNGPPVVDVHGNAIGGNSRVMTMQRVYTLHPEHARVYRSTLERQAKRYGLNPDQVSEMHQPVLVREVSPDEAIRVQHAITDLNKTGTAQLGPSERALVDSRRVSPETLDFIARRIDGLGESGTLAQVLATEDGVEIVNRLISDGAITEQDKAQYVASDKLTQEGKTRINRLMIGRFFSDVKQFDEAPAFIKNKLERIVAPLARIEQRPEWDVLTEPIKEALQLMEEARSYNLSRFEDVDEQAGMFGQQKYGPSAYRWAYALKNNSGKALATAFRKYAELESLSRPDTTVGMFAAEPVEQTDAFEDSFGELRGPRFGGQESVRLSRIVPSNYQPTEVLERFTNEQDGIEAVVAKVTGGFSVAIRDTDANEYYPVAQLFPTREQAIARARDAAVQAPLFDRGTEQEVRKAVQSDEDKLLGQRLTAQMKSGMASHPSKLKAAKNRSMFDEEEPDQPTLFSRVTPGFYSQLERTIEQKMPEKASVGQILGIVRNPQNGVKPDEIRWTDLDNYLAKQPGPIKKQDVLDYLKANGAQLQEVEKGETLGQKEGAPSWSEVGTNPSVGNTKFGQYVLPGGSNYRELLLTLPPAPSDFDPNKVGIKRHLQSVTQGETSVWYDGKKIMQYSDDPTPGADGQYRQRPDSHWMDVARDLYEKGDRINKVPQKGTSYRSPHWDEPNVLAHVRLDDRVDADGKKVLTVEEIQSDWGQSGKRKGFKGDFEVRPYITEGGHSNGFEAIDRSGRVLAHAGTAEKAREVASRSREQEAALPQMPFAKSWPELAFRRILRYGAEHGYARVAWTTGETQADRYDLSKQIDALHYTPMNDGEFGVDAMKDGHVVASQTGPPEKLEDFVGKEIVKKLVAGEGTPLKGMAEWKKLSGLDLKVGGEGMRAFYDSIMPAYANRYVKRWGAKVGETKIPTNEFGGNVYRGREYPLDKVEKVYEISKQRGLDVWNSPITGQRLMFPITRVAVTNQLADVSRLMGRGKSFTEAMAEAATTFGDNISDIFGGTIHEKVNTKPVTVHSIDISESMRKSVMEGQPLFAKSRQIAADANVPRTPTTYRHGILWVGSQTMNAITETLGLGRNVAAGMYVPPSRALALQKVVTGPLHKAIADALREGNSLVIVRHDAGTPISKSIALARHELFHSAEEWMGQAQRGHALLEDPLGSRAAEALKHIGYADIPSILFSEVGAHLAEGPPGWEKMGLKPAEAVQLFETYARLMAGESLSKLERIAPQLKDVLHAAQALRTSEIGLDSRRDTPNAENDQGPEGGPVRRGVQEALSREQQTPYERSARLEKSVALANVLDGIGATPQDTVGMSDEQWREAAKAASLIKGETVHPPHSYETKQEVAKQLNLIRQIRAQSGERGSAPMLGDLSQYLAEKFGKDAPRTNYSGIGAFERIALPGKQLSEIEKASPRVFKAALRAAGSESYASTLMRSSIPAIRHALKDSGHSWEELELYYVESRLRGLRARWQNFADQASAMTPDELQDAMRENADGSGSAFLDLLSKIEGRQGLAQDLGQTAAALAHAGEWDTLAEFLNQTFRDAADRVAHAMEDAEFDYIQDAVATDPQMKEADRLYGELLEKPMAESHSLNEGVFSDALGPANRYFPLMAAAREQVSPSGRRLPYRKPKNQSNAFATGLSESYDISMDAFAKKLSGAIRGNNKAALIDALLKQKWAVPESQAWTNEENQLVMDGPDGNEYLATREESSPGRALIQGRKVVRIPAHFIAMPKFVNRALKPILAREPMDPNSVIALMRWANNLATKGPLELIFHTNGVMGALYANTPFLGESLPAKLLSAPIAKWFDIRRRMYGDLLAGKLGLKNDPLDPSSPENVQKLLEMSQAGALPSRSGKVTYSKQIAEETGAKLERASFAPMLYGPHGLDARARILMYDIWKVAYPRGDVQSLHHFVNQIGNYIPELQGEIEKWFKHVGIGPFATAGMTRVVNGIHTFTGTGPGPGGTWKSRLWWWMTASAAAALAVWVIAHKELTGKWPMQDPRAKLFQIPVGGGSGAIDKFRHSKLGDARWGKNNNVGYINFSFLDNPLSMRGARALGVRAAFDTLNLKGTPGQAAEAANSDVINSFAEPVLGPFTRAAIVLGTGSTPYLTGFRDYRTGRAGISFMPAIPAKTKPGWPTAGERALSAAKQLNSLGAEAAENLGGLTGLYSPDQELPKGAGSWWMRSVLDLAAPGLFGNSGNPYAKRTSLRQQQRALGVR